MTGRDWMRRMRVRAERRAEAAADAIGERVRAAGLKAERRGTRLVVRARALRGRWLREAALRALLRGWR